MFSYFFTAGTIFVTQSLLSFEPFLRDFCSFWRHLEGVISEGNYKYPNILLKTLAYVRDIDGLILYFDFQCFTSPLLIGDKNQFWAKNHQTSAGRNNQTSTWLQLL